MARLLPLGMHTKINRMVKLLPEIDAMRTNGWRWSDMVDLVRDQLGDPGDPPMTDVALRVLVHRARAKLGKQKKGH